MYCRNDEACKKEKLVGQGMCWWHSPSPDTNTLSFITVEVLLKETSKYKRTCLPYFSVEFSADQFTQTLHFYSRDYFMPRGTKLLCVPLWALRQNVPEMPLVPWLQKLSLPQLAAALPAAGGWNKKETCFWGWIQTTQLLFLLLSCGWIPTGLLSTARSLDG